MLFCLFLDQVLLFYFIFVAVESVFFLVRPFSIFIGCFGEGISILSGFKFELPRYVFYKNHEYGNLKKKAFMDHLICIL